MSDTGSDSSVSLSKGLPETVLPPPPPEWETELEAALAASPDRGEQQEAVLRVAGAHPRYLEAWATLAESAADPVVSYAFARVGYHRGLDALRSAGWKGSGYVRAAAPTNRGFLRSLAALEAAASAIGEEDEAERCRQFRRQLDPG